MSFRVSSADFEIDVSGVERLHDAHNPNERQFEPVWARVHLFRHMDIDRIDVFVKGPLFSANGKELKTWGLQSFDQDDIEAGQAPAWVIDLIRQLVAADTLATKESTP